MNGPAPGEVGAIAGTGWLGVVAPIREPLLTWRSAAPGSAQDAAGSDVLLDAVAPLVVDVDLAPVREALRQNDPHAFGALRAVRAGAPAVTDALVHIGKTMADAEQFAAVLGGSGLIVALAKAAGRLDQLASAYLLQARSCRAMLDTSGATAAYQRALAIVPESNAARRSLINHNLGNLLNEAGHCDSALRCYADALRAETDPRNRAGILQSRAAVFRDLGEFGAAASLEREAADLLQALPMDPGNQAYELDESAQRLAKAGDTARALALNQQAAILLAGGDLLAMAQNAEIRAVILLRAQDANGAAAAYAEARDAATKAAKASVDAEHYHQGFLHARQHRLPQSDPAIQALRNGAFAGAQQRIVDALRLLSEASKLAAACDDHATALRSRALLGGLLFDSGDVPGAESVLQDVQREAGGRGIALPEISALVTLSSSTASGSDFSRNTLGYLSRAATLLALLKQIVADVALSGIEAATEINDTGALENQLALRAQLYGLNAVAAEEFGRAAALAGDNFFARANRLSGLLLSLVGPAQAARAEMVASELRALLGNPALPLRGRVIAAWKLGKYEQDADPDAARELLGDAAQALEKLRKTVPMPLRASVDRQSLALPGALAAARRRAGDIPGAFEALQLGRGRALLYADAMRGGGEGLPPKLAAMQNALSPGDVLVEIAVEPDTLAAYIVTRDSLKTVVVSGDTAALAVAEHGDVRDRASALLALAQGNALVGAFATAVETAVPPGAGLLVVPDPRLGNLPLHAIQIGGRPWCERRRIGQSPASGAICRDAIAQTGAVFVAGNSRGDLPGAEAECLAIAQVYRTDARTGQACTAAALLSAIASGPLDVVHLAVHGRGNPRRGGQASLLLADGAGGTAWVDLDTLTTSTWRVGVAVLSGCSTGLTGVRNGSELISVAGQILQAGARAVVACLWPVGDAAARIAMTRFHQALTEGDRTELDLRVALDEARGTLHNLATPADGLRNGRDIEPDDVAAAPSDPALGRALDWSAFVHVGAPRPFSQKTHIPG